MCCVCVCACVRVLLCVCFVVVVVVFVGFKKTKTVLKQTQSLALLCRAVLCCFFVDCREQQELW